MIEKDGEEAREHAAEVIAAGGVVAFRTDTFYGLGADPFNPEAVRRVNELKGRDGKPILVVISDASEAERFIINRSKIFDAICARHWPGALTIVVDAKPEAPFELTAGSGTVGLRLPFDEAVRSFIRECGGALTATSANIAGAPPARTAEEVANFFPEGINLIVDDGTARGEKPSTVLDISCFPPHLIREGAVTRNELEETFRNLGVEVR
jgi:L-threonylcarbamoyladenylate synthase